MKHTKTIVLTLSLIWLAASGSAIDLKEYIELLMANHPFFQKEELALEVEYSRRGTLLPRSEWQFSLSPQYGIADNPVGSEFLQSLSQSAILEAGMERTFVDGRWVGFSASSAYTWLQDPLYTTEHSSFQHGFELSMSWPLLVDVERLSRLGYDLHEYMIKAKEVEMQENRESFLVEPALQFIEWAYALELVEIYRQRLVLAEEQLATTNRMYRANLVEKLDVMRAEDAVRMAQQAIFEYESIAKSIQTVLATLAGAERIYNERPDFDFFSFVELPPASEAAARAKGNTRLKKPLSFAIERLKYSEDASEEEEKPSLNLYFQAGIFGPEDPFLDSLMIIHPQATVGLSYSPPYGLERLKAQRKLIGTEIEQLEKDIENMEKTVETNVRSLLIQAAELQKIIELSRELIESAEEKTLEEARLYSQGRNILTNVLQSRDSVQDQRARLVESFARYHRLIVYYRAWMDELLD